MVIFAAFWRTRYKTIVQHVFKNLTFANPNIAFRENAIPENGVIQIVFDFRSQENTKAHQSFRIVQRETEGVERGQNDGCERTPLRLSIEKNITKNSLKGYNLDRIANFQRLTYHLSHQTAAKHPSSVRIG